jgi:hypothetical protein
MLAGSLGEDRRDSLVAGNFSENFLPAAANPADLRGFVAS